MPNRDERQAAALVLRLRTFQENWLPLLAMREFVALVRAVHDCPRLDHADEPLRVWLDTAGKQMAGKSTAAAARCRARRRAAGVCINGCGRPPQAERSRCRECGVEAAEAARRRYWLQKFGQPKGGSHGV